MGGWVVHENIVFANTNKKEKETREKKKKAGMHFDHGFLPK